MFPDRPRLRYTKALNPSMSKQSLLDNISTSSSSLKGVSSMDDSDTSISSSPKSLRRSTLMSAQGSLRHMVLKRFDSEYVEGRNTAMGVDTMNQMATFNQSAIGPKTTTSFTPETKRKTRIISGGRFPPKQLNTNQGLVLSRTNSLANMGALTQDLNLDEPSPISLYHNPYSPQHINRESNEIDYVVSCSELFEPSPVFRKKIVLPSTLSTDATKLTKTMYEINK